MKALLFLMCAACTTDEAHDCKSEDLEVVAWRTVEPGQDPAKPVLGDVAIEVSAVSATGGGVASVWVDGVPAAKGQDGLWSLNLAWELLVALPLEADGLTREVPVEVRDWDDCTGSDLVAVVAGSAEAGFTLEVTVDTTLDPVWLPADGSAGAEVRLVPEPLAIGQTAALAVEGAGLAGDPTEIVLEAGGATFWLIPDADAKMATVIATLGSLTRVGSVEVIGPPSFVAPSLDGVEPFALAVSSEGILTTCAASWSGGGTLDVSLPDGSPLLADGQSLGEVALPADTSRTSIAVAFGPDAQEGSVLTLSCTDPWGQTGELSFPLPAGAD